MVKGKLTLDLVTARKLWKIEDNEVRKLILSSGYTEEDMEPDPINILDIRRDCGYKFSNDFKEVPVKWKASNRMSVCEVPLFIGEKECNAAIAFEQLGWLMKEYNYGWKPNWLNTSQQKFAIVRKFGTDEKYMIIEARYEYKYIVFRDRETAKLFLKEQLEIIEKFYGVVI